MILIRCTQILYFIDLMRSRLKFIDEELQNTFGLQEFSEKLGDEEEIGNQIEVKNKLMWIRAVFSKLHTLNILINECFGLSLVPIVVVLFINIAVNLYWQILVMLIKMQGANLFRKNFSVRIDVFCLHLYKFISRVCLQYCTSFGVFAVFSLFLRWMSGTCKHSFIILIDDFCFHQDYFNKFFTDSKHYKSNSDFKFESK